LQQGKTGILGNCVFATLGVAEGESATCADIIEEFYNLTKFTTK